jgi:hypothetical protein
MSALSTRFAAAPWHRAGQLPIRDPGGRFEPQAPFSIVALLARQLPNHRGTLPMRIAAWYAKPRATFIDALARVPAHL